MDARSDKKKRSMRRELADYAVKHLKEHLPDEYQDCEVVLGEVVKSNNRHWLGVRIERGGSKRISWSSDLSGSIPARYEERRLNGQHP